MPTATCLVNSTRKQFTRIYEYSSEIVGYYLRELEKQGWDLRHDDIYVSLCNTTIESYTDYTGIVQSYYHLPQTSIRSSGGTNPGSVGPNPNAS